MLNLILMNGLLLMKIR